MMKKKLMAMVLGLAVAVTTLTACGSSEVSTRDEKKAETKTEETTKTYKIGIQQFAQHGSLDNCREGFIKGLKAEGFEEGKNLEIDIQNADTDMGIANQIAQSFVSDKADLICGIATPSAQSCYNAALNQNIPVIYTAVTDPLAAELAKEDGTPTGNATGTSDKLPVEEQLKMMREILPEAKKLGIMYTTSETNSESAIEEYKSLVGNYGFELITKGISTAADIPLAADDLLSQADCVTNLTDNTVVSGLTTILDKANAKGVPVFGSEIEQVKIGCLAAEGLDYVALGEQTGKMAAKVLKGEAKASELKVETIKSSSLYVNEKVAENLKIEVPSSMKDRAAETFKDISAE